MDNLEQIVTLTSMLFIFPPLCNSTCVTHYLKWLFTSFTTCWISCNGDFSINFVWLVSKIFFISFTNFSSIIAYLSTTKSKNILNLRCITNSWERQGLDIVVIVILVVTAVALIYIFRPLIIAIIIMAVDISD